MNILDLKKLMLVPLVCCTSMQQVNADVQEDREAEKNLKEQSENFADIVKRYQETGINQQFPDPLSVACKMNIGPNMQMGGLIAFIQDNAKARKVFVYQGAKQKSDPRNMPPRNDLPNSLLAVNNYSHTERQLVSAVITKIKEKNVGLSGAMHIYTYMPPCADTHKDENGQLTCCEYYPLVATQFKNIEFHIYFKYPTLNDLRTYFDFDTVQKVKSLKNLLSSFLSTMNINLDQKVSTPLVDPRPLWHCNKDQLQWFVKLNTNDEAVLNRASSDAYRHIVDEVFEILQDFTDIQLAKACEDEIKNLYNIVINTSCHDDTTISGRIKFHLLQ